MRASLRAGKSASYIDNLKRKYPLEQADLEHGEYTHRIMLPFRREGDEVPFINPSQATPSQWAVELSSDALRVPLESMLQKNDWVALNKYTSAELGMGKAKPQILRNVSLMDCE